MRPTLRLLVAALACLAFAPLARAEMLPSWSYSTTPTASPIASDNNPFTGGVTFSPVASTTVGGSADILLTNIRVFSSALASSPDQFLAGGQYGITLSVHDTASGMDGSVTFAGKLSGTFSLSAADLSNAFTGLTSQTLTLGVNTYAVSVGTYLPPGFPPSTPPGAIYAHVDTLGGGGVAGGPGTADTPEPSTLLLCSVGAAGCVLSRLKARRQRRSLAS